MDDEYGALIDQDVQTGMRSSMFTAAGTEPDAEAKLQKLAVKANLPLDAVRQNQKQVQADVQLQDFDYEDVVKQTPKLAQWFNEPNNASVAHDDVKPLGSMEKLLSYPVNTIRATVASLGGANAGLWGIAQAGGDLLSGAITSHLAGTILPTDLGLEISEAAGRRRQLAIEAGNYLRGEQKGAGFAEKAIYSGFESLGTTALTLPFSIATGNPAPTLYGLSAVTGGDAYGAARQKGIDPINSANYAASQAVIEFATEKMPAVTLIKDLGAKVGFKRLLADQMLHEIPGEQVATVLQDLNEWAVLNPEQTVSDYLKARPSRAAETLIATMVATGAQTTVAHTMDRVVNGSQQKQTENFFTALAEGTKESKLFQRLPERYQDLVAQYTQDGPVQNVFVDAQAVNQYYQSIDVDPAAAMATAGVTNFHEALASGGDVVIPMAGFATHIAPTDALQALMPDLRLAQGDSSSREMDLDEANAAGNDEAMQRNIEEITAAAQTDVSLNSAINEIINDVSGQLQGRYDQGTANQMATVMRGIAVLANRANPTADPVTVARQLWAKYGLKINASPLPDVLTQKPDFDVQVDSMIDRIRKGDIPTAEQVNGQSVVEFVREAGGIHPADAEQSSKDNAKTRKPFQKSLVSEKAQPLSKLVEMAIENGYLNEGADEAALLDLLDGDLAGTPAYSAANRDTQLGDQADALGSLAEWLNKMGVDLNANDNAAVKQLIAGATGEDVSYNQPAYHGTPYNFDKFSLEHLGSGEGAQAYGWGLYFAGDKSVAEYYRNTTSLQKIEGVVGSKYGDTQEGAERTAAGLMYSYKTDRKTFDGYDDGGETYMGKIAQDIKNGVITSPEGQLYEVDIPEDKDYLHWDSYISDQPKHIKDVIKTIIKAEEFGHGWTSDAGQSRTGAEFYEKLSKQLGSDEAASKYLHAEGLPGIKYLDGNSRNNEEGSYNYVVFDDKAIDIVQTYYQGEDDKRGSIQIRPENFAINLFKNANFSTMLHETGHFYLEVLGDLASTDNASPQVKEDYATILKWMGVKDRAGIQTEQHEMFARANELYLMEGKAPSNALRAVFQRFKAWLQFIYKTASSLNVDINNDVRAVFDRIYATDAEIEQAKDQDNFQELFLTAAEAGMTDAEFNAYKNIAALQTEDAKDKLRKQTMRIERLKRESWWKEERANVAREVADEYDALPAVIAFNTMVQKDAPVKINKADLVRRYGEGIKKQLRRGYGEGKGAIYGDEGYDVDIAAQMLGYEDGDTMINAITNLPKRDRYIAAESDRRMIEKHGDVLNDVALADAAQEALHNEKREQVLKTELRTIRKLVAPARKLLHDIDLSERKQAADIQQMPIEYFKDAAKGMIGQKAVKDLNPNGYLVAERKASRAAFEAMGKKDYLTAATMKQRELLNHYLFLEATKAQAEADKIVDYAKSLMKATAQERIGKAGNDYLENINGILEQYEFKKRTNAQLDLIRQARALADKAEEMGEVIEIDEDLLSLPVNYRELPMDELRTVRDMLKNIEHVAKEVGKFRAAEEERDIFEIAYDSLKEIREGTDEKDLPRRSRRNPNEDRKRKIASYFNEMRGLGSYIREAVGFKENSVLWNYTVRVLNTAAAKESKMLHEASQKLDALFGQYDRTYLYGKGKVIPGVGALNKMEQLMIAASYGTETGRQRMRDIGLDGKGFSQQEIDSILDSLEEKDWTFVKGLWADLDSYWADVAAKQKRVTGVEPEKVEASPFETRFGTMPGGYSPIAYESRNDNTAAANDQAQLAKEMKSAAFTRATTRRGHTKSRENTVKDKGGVRYDFGLIYKHLNEVIHDLTHHEALRDVTKLLNHKVDGISILDEINARMGDGVRDQIKNVLDEIAVGSLRNLTEMERLAESASKGVAIAQMGYNFWNAAQNFTGYAQTASVIGTKWAAHGATQMISRGKEPMAKSQFMQTRFINFNRDVNAMRGKLHERKGVKAVDTTLETFQAASMYMLTKVQQAVDIPTWLGAYDKAKAQDPNITEDNAVALADQAVVDAQGGGRTVDLSSFMRAKGAQRIFNVFAGYFNVTYQRTVEAMKKARVDDYSPAAVGNMVAEMFYLLIVPSIATTLLKEAIDLAVGGEPDDDLWLQALKDQASYLLAMFPYARELSSGLFGYGSYSGPIGLRVFKDLNDFIKQSLQGELDEAAFKSAVKVVGDFTGLPTGQILKTYDGFVNGEGNPLSWVFGAPKESK